MNQRNAIVLLIDGLNPAYLSPTGCAWIETPTLDELAAESVLCERAITESVDPVAACWSFLSGKHPGFHANEDSVPQHSPEDSSWWKTLQVSGMSTLLLSDAPGQFPQANQFDRVVDLGSTASGEISEGDSVAGDVRVKDDSPLVAEDVAETFLAKCFSSALNEIPKQASPFFCLIHISSLTRIWDAPQAIREKFRDEDDPEAFQGALPPCTSGEFDPDQILVWTQAYAAQLETLDTCLQVLLHELRLDGLLQETLFLLAGLRGFPLGHHGQVGQAADHLYSDATSIPIFVRPADSQQQAVSAVRYHQLTALSDWFTVVEDWLTGQRQSPLAGLFQTGDEKTEGGGTESPSLGNGLATRQWALVQGGQAAAIWTPVWLMIRNQESTLKLFVKPDDRWDCSPVQDRCRWVASELEDVLLRLSKQLNSREAMSVDPLADELVIGLE